MGSGKESRFMTVGYLMTVRDLRRMDDDAFEMLLVVGIRLLDIRGIGVVCSPG